MRATEPKGWCVRWLCGGPLSGALNTLASVFRASSLSTDAVLKSLSISLAARSRTGLSQSPMQAHPINHQQRPGHDPHPLQKKRAEKRKAPLLLQLRDPPPAPVCHRDCASLPPNAPPKHQDFIPFSARGEIFAKKFLGHGDETDVSIPPRLSIVPCIDTHSSGHPHTHTHTPSRWNPSRCPLQGRETICTTAPLPMQT